MLADDQFAAVENAASPATSTEFAADDNVGDPDLPPLEESEDELGLPLLEDSDIQRTVWIVAIERDDGSREQMQVLFTSDGKALWEGSRIPRSGVWSLRPDRLLFTREMLLGFIGFKETYVAAPTVSAGDDLKLKTSGVVRGWGYFSPALKIGDFEATRKSTNVGT